MGLNKPSSSSKSSDASKNIPVCSQTSPPNNPHISPIDLSGSGIQNTNSGHLKTNMFSSTQLVLYVSLFPPGPSFSPPNLQTSG